MILDPTKIKHSDKGVLTGIFLSKFDEEGLRRLGFSSLKEAFNVLGYALGLSPRSIKLYRDEFDPIFPNARLGFHKRKPHPYRLKILDEYKDLDFETFSGLIGSFVGSQPDVGGESRVRTRRTIDEASFAKRLITGLAAEQYFETCFSKLDEFRGYGLQNTTRLGCGYDFRLEPSAGSDFLAVEVKGLAENAGNISLTPKEHFVAGAMGDRYFLFVVKNFKKAPSHRIFPNPLSGRLEFTRKESRVVQVSWLAAV